MAFVALGGTKKVAKVTDVIVPIMAVVYVLTVLVLIVLNITRIPWFFYAVFTQAFRPGSRLWRALSASPWFRASSAV